MKRILVLFCLVSSLLFLMSGASKAKSILFFAPMRLDLSQDKPISEMRVTNTSKLALSYNVSVENLAMSEDGVTYRVDDFEYSAKRMLRFVPRQFDLEPGKTQIVRVMARIPNDVEDGEYHSHIEFLENVKRRGVINETGEKSYIERAEINAQLSYSAAVPITVSKGNVSTQLEMQNVKLEKLASGGLKANFDIHRSGNGQGNLYLEADYIAPDGSVTSAATRRTVYVYREIDVRKHSFILNLLDREALPSAGQINVKLYNRDISEDEPVQEVVLPLS